MQNLKAEKDYGLIHYDSVYNVFRIHNKKAASHLAKNTKWLDEMNSEYLFEYYSEFTIFYFIIKNNKLDKVVHCNLDNKFVYFDKAGINTDGDQFLNIIRSDYANINIKKYFNYLSPIFIAGHANCPFYIMAKLSNDNDSIIRERVASNPSCPVELLWKLSIDIDRHVKLEVVRNINCPIEILEKLSSDEDRIIREEMARSPNCPVEILEKLGKDVDSSVRKIANSKLSLVRGS
jgi:hypothetical protein